MNTTKLVQEAPYHPGYEDAVIEPAFAYKGVDPSKMIWKPKPLTEEEIMDIAEMTYSGSFEVESGYEYEIRLARAIEKRHGIK
jgi:hypothetical protein